MPETPPEPVDTTHLSYPRTDVTTPLYTVTIACDWDIPQFNIEGEAVDALKDAGVSSFETTIHHAELTVRAENTDVDTLHDAVLNAITGASDGLMGFPTDGELDDSFTVEAHEAEQCHYGCGKQAVIRDAPMVVNGRLYTGNLCQDCHTAPENLKSTFHEETKEHMRLTELQTAYEHATT
ncbi:hypothetical protein [Salinibaculum rarum]|uniref:hypothetical protein n=1 Tax=Salinibaculum rarum TaxID=3058903 RepID=UPI00265D7A08|nr:hypothetical protein [Salinibaculum sp. KK48]